MSECEREQFSYHYAINIDEEVNHVMRIGENEGNLLVYGLIA